MSEQERKSEPEPQECMPCRGSGVAISNLGGSTAKVECPWCAGNGVRSPGIDAQARWIDQRQDDSSGESAGNEQQTPENGV